MQVAVKMALHCIPATPCKVCYSSHVCPEALIPCMPALANGAVDFAAVAGVIGDQKPQRWEQVCIHGLIPASSFV